jgi:hypothetical protein
MEWIIVVVVFIVIVVALSNTSKPGSNSTGKKISPFEEFVQVTPETLRIYCKTDKNGFAVDPKGEQIFIYGKKNKAVYPFSKVREWITGRDAAIWPGDNNRLHIVIRVADIDYPEWKLWLGDDLVKRGFEILVQAINEGGLKDV